MQPPMPRHQHHVVSAGYLRFFADAKQRLRLIDKPTRSAIPRLVGVRNAFVRTHFNSVVDGEGRKLDHLESEWAERESFALPRIRHLDPTRVEVEDDAAVKILIALHYARSFAAREMHDRIADETLTTFVADMRELAELQRLFELEYGRAAVEGELESLAEQQWAARRSTNQMFVESIAKGFNTGLDLLKDASLELVVPAHPTLRFGTGDSPVVVSNQELLSVGPLGGVPLADASVVYMPLRQDLAAAVTHGAPRLLQANGVEIVRLNTLVWRAAIRHVACHPEDDWRRVFNVRS